VQPIKYGPSLLRKGPLTALAPEEIFPLFTIPVGEGDITSPHHPIIKANLMGTEKIGRIWSFTYHLEHPLNIEEGGEANGLK
jgi:hypothetical protein